MFTCRRHSFHSSLDIWTSNYQSILADIVYVLMFLRSHGIYVYIQRPFYMHLQSLIDSCGCNIMWHWRQRTVEPVVLNLYSVQMFTCQFILYLSNLNKVRYKQITKKYYMVVRTGILNRKTRQDEWQCLFKLYIWGAINFAPPVTTFLPLEKCLLSLFLRLFSHFSGKSRPINC